MPGLVYPGNIPDNAFPLAGKYPNFADTPWPRKAVEALETFLDGAPFVPERIEFRFRSNIHTVCKALDIARYGGRLSETYLLSPDCWWLVHWVEEPETCSSLTFPNVLYVSRGYDREAALAVFKRILAALPPENARDLSVRIH